jgi:hypothetical protein
VCVLCGGVWGGVWVGVVGWGGGGGGPQDKLK